MTHDRLARLKIAGFRSLRSVTLELEPLTVLIGPNGAGKSNLLWALEMVRMMASGSLQLFVGERGGATYLMYYGPQTTEAIDIELELHADNLESIYLSPPGLWRRREPYFPGRARWVPPILHCGVALD